MTWVVTEAALLAVAGSPVVAVTLAVSVIEPGGVAAATVT
jgi:hypothetical protein